MIITNEDIVRFEKGKKGNYIAHDSFGKIILSKNNVKPGYYKISNIEQREHSNLCNTERVPFDYFPEITYDEFLDVLKWNGFKIGFIENFHYGYKNYSGDDHLIFAYDMKTHIVIVAQSWNSGETFKSIKVYCPGMDRYSVRRGMFVTGDSSITIFDLIHDKFFNKNKGTLHIIKENMEDIVDQHRNIYNDSTTINLWNYSEVGSPFPMHKHINKIRLADREDMLELFKGSKLMLDALKDDQMKLVKCVSIRNSVPDQIIAGKEYWIDYSTAHRLDGVEYACVYLDRAGMRPIGSLMTRHFEIVS